MADDQKKPEEKQVESKDKEVKSEKKVKVSASLQKIIDLVEKLSVLELSELVKALEEKFGVSASAPMAVAAAPSQSDAANTAPEASDEKSEYTVVLSSAGANKIAVIKALRVINPELGLKDAKDLADAAPKPVVENVSKETAETAKKNLEEAGAQVELK